MLRTRETDIRCLPHRSLNFVKFSHNVARWMHRLMNDSKLYSQAVRKLLPPYAEAVDNLVNRFNPPARASNAPRRGEPMPPFILPEKPAGWLAWKNCLRRSGCRRFSSRPLVPVVSHQHQRAGSCDAEIKSRRPSCGDHARSPKIRRRVQARGRLAVSGLYGYGQRLRAVTEPGRLAGAGS